MGPVSGVHVSLACDAKLKRFGWILVLLEQDTDSSLSTEAPDAAKQFMNFSLA